MPFVLKKSKSVRVPLGEGKDSLVLLVKKIKVEKILSLYQEHMQFLEEAEDAKVKGEEMIRLPIELMRDLKNTLMEAAVGWENVTDENGKEIPFSKDLLEEIVAHDMNLYMEMMKGISRLYGNPDLDKSEKNSLNTSTSAAVH